LPRRITPLTAARKAKLLGYYATHGHLRLACEQSDVPRSTHLHWLQDDPEYAAAFTQADEEATERLIEEVHRRGFLGWEEPVTYQGGFCYEKLANGRKKQVAIRKFDSNLAMFLLKAKRPEQFRDTWKGEIRHSGAVGRGPDLSNLTDDQLQQLQTLFRLTDGSSSSPVEGIADGSAGGAGEESEAED
jgi:hypothetical protein